MHLATEKELNLPPDFQRYDWYKILPMTVYDLVPRINEILESEGKKKVLAQSVFNWVSRRVPLEWVPYVESATRFKVTRYDMRPDYFGNGPCG